jgi:hypothetical protein
MEQIVKKWVHEGSHLEWQEEHEQEKVDWPKYRYR